MQIKKTLSDFKRLKEGTIMKLVEYGNGNRPHKYLSITRRIDKKQSNSFRFEGGSWVEYPLAKEFNWEGDIVSIGEKNSPIFLAYQIINEVY